MTQISSNSVSLRKRVIKRSKTASTSWDSSVIQVGQYKTAIIDLKISGVTDLNSGYVHGQLDGVNSRPIATNSKIIHQFERLESHSLVFDVTSNTTFNLLLSLGTNTNATIEATITLIHEQYNKELFQFTPSTITGAGTASSNWDITGGNKYLKLNITLTNSINSTVRVFGSNDGVDFPTIWSSSYKIAGKYTEEIPIENYRYLRYQIVTTGSNVVIERFLTDISLDKSDYVTSELKNINNTISGVQWQELTPYKFAANIFDDIIPTFGDYMIIELTNNMQDGATLFATASHNNSKKIPIYDFSDKKIKQNVTGIPIGANYYIARVNYSPIKLTVWGMQGGDKNSGSLKYYFIDNLMGGIEVNPVLTYETSQNNLFNFLNGYVWKVNYNYIAGENTNKNLAFTYVDDGKTAASVRGPRGYTFGSLAGDINYEGYLDLTHINKNRNIQYRAVATIANQTPILLTLEEKVEFKDEAIFENNNIKVSKNEFGPNSDVYDECVVVYTDTTVKLSYNYGDTMYEIPLNSDNFPNLKEGSKVKEAKVLPASGSSSGNLDKRIVVLTDRNQTYHNKPYVSPTQPYGNFLNICKFEESVIWDYPVEHPLTSEWTNAYYPNKRFIPSKDINAVAPYKYFPCLPDGTDASDNNDNWYAIPNTDTFPAIKDVSNNGWTIKVPRFIIGTEWGNHPLHSLRNNTVKQPGITYIGSYASPSNRPCLFYTKDGGREWFNVYEFGHTTYGQEGLNGVAVNTNITEVASNLGSGVLNIIKRGYNLPSAEVKEPATKFILGEPIAVTSITKGKPAVVTTSTPHGLSNREMIYFTKQNATVSEWDFLVNDSVTTNDGGNGVFFFVHVIDSTSFRLYFALSNPESELPARHIHSVNEFNSGITVSVGEEFGEQGGWIMQFTYTKVPPRIIWGRWEKLLIYRLNSTVNSIARACGFIIKDGDVTNPTCYFASDAVDITPAKLSIEGRTVKTRSVNISGVFKGKLLDIDDATKWELIHPFPYLLEGMRQFNDSLIAISTRSICVYHNDKWYQITNHGNNVNFTGENHNVVRLGDLKVELK